MEITLAFVYILRSVPVITHIPLCGEESHMIEEELIHWFVDEKEKKHRSALRIESIPPTLNKGYPRDGIITLRIMNGIGAIGFKCSPDEALKLSTQLLTVAKEQLQKKRRLWNERDETR